MMSKHVSRLWHVAVFRERRQDMSRVYKSPRDRSAERCQSPSCAKYQCSKRDLATPDAIYLRIDNREHARGRRVRVYTSTEIISRSWNTCSRTLPISIFVSLFPLSLSLLLRFKSRADSVPDFKVQEYTKRDSDGFARK